MEGLPVVGAQSSSSNILLGTSVPIYDGKIRTARVQEAESRAAASDIFKKNSGRRSKGDRGFRQCAQRETVSACPS